MNPTALLALISELYGQVAEQSARAERAESALAELQRAQGEAAKP